MLSVNLFAQCDADHLVILNNFEFVPSELVIEPGESVAFMNIEGIHTVNGLTNSITGEEFNNPVDFFIDEVTGNPEGVCMGVLTFDAPGIYNFDSSYGFDAQAGMSLMINSDAFVLEDLFAEINANQTPPIWQAQYAFQSFTPSYLTGEAPFTLFAPNDEAVSQILEYMSLGQFDILGLPDFPEIMQFHIAEGLHYADDLYDGLTLVSAQGQNLNITQNGSELMIENAQIVSTDYTAYNGVIHVIDQCLAPESSPEANVMQAIAESPNHSILESALIEIGLDDELAFQAVIDDSYDGPGPWTVFAPTDAAFETFCANEGWTIDELLGSQFLYKIITQHIVNSCVDNWNVNFEIDEYCYDGSIDPLMSEDLLSSSPTNLDDEQLQFSLNDSIMFVEGEQNTVAISLPDVLTYNGVVHVVDGVLEAKLPGIEPGSCDLWTLELDCSSNSGWEGNALALVRNNVLQETITVLDGSQENIYQFGVNNLDVIDLLFIPGSGGSSLSYKLKNSNGDILAQSSETNNNPVSSILGVHACKPIDEALCEEITIEMFNDYGYGWYASSLDVYRNGTFDVSILMETGYQQLSTIDAYENDSFDFVVNINNFYPEENGYLIRDASGAILVNENTLNIAPLNSSDIVICESNVNVGINEPEQSKAQLIKMVDVLGRVQKAHNSGELLFYIYDNGTVRKYFKK